MIGAVLGNPGSVVGSVRMNPSSLRSYAGHSRRNGEWEEDMVGGKGDEVGCQVSVVNRRVK